MDKTPERKRVNVKHHTPTGAWKDRFRKGCMERLKNKRQDFVNSLRQADGYDSSDSSQSSQGFVNQLMVDEWEKMKLESPLLSNLPQCGCPRDNEKFVFDDEDNDNIEDILSVFEDIQSELLREEQQMLLKYDDIMSYNEEYLCAAIDLLTTDSVTCPLCKRNNLLQNKQIIFCSCGLRIDTEADCIDLKYIQKQLNDSITSHSSPCSVEPEFSVIDLSGNGVKNLIMTCQTCDFMGIII